MAEVTAWEAPRLQRCSVQAKPGMRGHTPSAPRSTGSPLGTASERSVYLVKLCGGYLWDGCFFH